MPKQITEQEKEQIIEAVQSHTTMRAAARSLSLSYGTFIYRAKKLNVYKPNQGGCGIKNPNKASGEISVDDIITGKVKYKGGSATLKKKLLDKSILINECYECGMLPEWNGKYLTLQLDHIDGDHNNNLEENLRILCPNCHTQTPTHSGKNKGSTGYKTISEIPLEIIKEVSQRSHSINAAARELNLNWKSQSVALVIKQYR